MLVRPASAYALGAGPIRDLAIVHERRVIGRIRIAKAGGGDASTRI